AVLVSGLPSGLPALSVLGGAVGCAVLGGCLSVLGVAPGGVLGVVSASAAPANSSDAAAAAREAIRFMMSSFGGPGLREVYTCATLTGAAQPMNPHFPLPPGPDAALRRALLQRLQHRLAHLARADLGLAGLHDVAGAQALAEHACHRLLDDVRLARK